MSKRNTRLRVARIAAAAVIAGGASLTAVGAAQAVTNDSASTPSIHVMDETTGPTDPLSGANGGPVDPTTNPPTDDPTTNPPTDDPTTNPPTDDPTTNPPTDDPTTNPPTDEPTTNPPTTGTTSGANGGNANGGTSAPPSSPSGTNPDGNNNTCTLTGESVDCGNNDTNTDNTQPVPQGDTSSQLAETGSNGTAFLLIGAATLIAGGIGFRISPRLAANRRNAA
ncbi:LPXTG cell wall anchor domain-containing protein [Streptomyces sp. NBC_01198]|uniref:LPXTG cell wall anchor domain-containing protein n=1 Tax=Streptomyces sp. NBC_01198 TaxID=2903769 RepID=UPI002E1332EC|nr:LPXTG cell wall anchor domain-containing protein [Streptomyces sp. NBC_01198]